jgi:hypothetical protein
MSVHRELREIVERGLCRRGNSLYGSSVRGTWMEGDSFVGALKVIKGRLCRRESLFMEALKMDHLSLWELCDRNLEGGLPHWVP